MLGKFKKKILEEQWTLREQEHIRIKDKKSSSAIYEHVAYRIKCGAKKILGETKGNIMVKKIWCWNTEVEAVASEKKRCSKKWQRDNF